MDLCSSRVLPPSVHASFVFNANFDGDFITQKGSRAWFNFLFKMLTTVTHSLGFLYKFSMWNQGMVV